MKTKFKLLGIIFASSFPYLFSLEGDFVFDDSEAIVKNKDVVSESLLDPFCNDFWGTNIRSNLSHKSYRPLTILSFRFNYLLNNKNLSSMQFKITNLLCHIVCCLLIWCAFCMILKRVKMKEFNNTILDLAFVATLLFCVHPVHVEAVSGIVGRADILAAITFFIAFILYDKAMDNTGHMFIYLSMSLVISGTSVLFKENGITVLGFCLLYEIVSKIKFRHQNFSLGMDSKTRIICLVIASISFICGRIMVMGGSRPDFKPTDNPAAFSDSFFVKVASYNYIYFINALLFIWPQWLCYDWSMGCVRLIKDILDYRILLIILIYIFGILCLKCIFSSRNRKSTKRLTAIAVSLIIVPFLPASNIFYPVGFVIAERILYIPSVGYCLFFALGISKLSNLTGIKSKAVKIGFYFLLLTYTLRSWQRSSLWQTEYQLFLDALSVCPLNAKVHYNIAKVVDTKHHTDWALYHYKEAIRLYPQYYQAMNNIANLLKDQKKFAEAESRLRTALHYKEDFPAAWMNLGIVLAATKKYDESKIAYKQALKYRSNYPDCFYNLGNLFLEIGESNHAMENWLFAVNLNPTHVSAWTNLLALLDNSGQIEKALQIIPKAMTELPNSPSINFAIANIYGKIDKYSEAENYFLKAIQLFGDRVQAIHYANLGVLYHRWKKYSLAENMYRRALQIDRSFLSAKRNLENLQKILNK